VAELQTNIRMSSRRLLIENIASLSVLQALNYAAPLITLPYLVRVLQPAQFGLLSFAQGVVLYFAFLTDFGFNFSQTRAIAACRHLPDSVSRIFWSTILAKALLMAMSAVALFLLVTFTPRLRNASQLIAVNFLYVIGTTFFPIWLFQGLERMKLAAVFFGIGRLATVPALLLFVKQPQDYVIAGAIQASVEVTASILAWPTILRWMGVRWYQPSLRDVANALKQAWPVFLSSSAVQLSASGTIVILGFTAGKTEVGYFSAADKLIKACIAALNPFGQALYPHITAARLRSPESAFHVIRKAFFIVGILSASISIATALWARPACHLLLGNSFEHSIPLLRWLSPLPLLFGLSSIFGTQTMLVFEMDSILSKIMLVTALISLPLTLFFSISLQAVGAAIASVATATIMVVGMLLTLRAKGMHIWRRPNAQVSRVVETACVPVE
jgi:polysaccharide transporter, PST family